MAKPAHRSLVRRQAKKLSSTIIENDGIVRYVVVFLTTVFFFGCAGTIKETGDEYHAIRYAASYRLALESVERPESATVKYGTAVLDSLPIDSLYYSSFEDAAFKILWSFNSRFIGCAIKNKTESAIKIMWNEGAYVDATNTSHPLGHSQFYNYESAPSIILKKTNFEDSIYPRDYPFYSVGEPLGGPIRKPLFLDYDLHGPINHGKYRTLQDFEAAVSLNMWTSSQVLLPMEIDGQLHDYLFTFRVTRITTERSVHDISPFSY